MVAKARPAHRAMFVALALLALTPGWTYPQVSGCSPPPQEIVSWWQAEGNALDLLGTNPGSLLGGTTFTPGLVGQAFSFDGVDDYVEIPETPSLTFANNEAFTLETWFMPLSEPDPGGVTFFILKNANYGFEWRGTQASLAFYNGSYHYSTKTAWTLGQWYHLVMVDDGSSSVKLYVDGLLDKSDDGPARSPNRFGGFSVFLGVNWLWNFHGLLDEVSLYSRALSTEEIRGIFLAGSDGKCASTTGGCPSAPSDIVSWWPGNNNSLDTVGNNHGIAVNGAGYSPGRVNSAFSFDGINDYVNAFSAPGSFFSNSEAFTLEAWFRAESETSSYFVLRNAAFGLRWQGTSSPMEFFNGTDHFSSKNSWQLDRWYHVALVDDGASSVKLYIDGVLDKSDDGPLRNPNRFPCHSAGYCFELQFGGYYETHDVEYFKGQVDEVTLYSRALGASEIQAIFAADSQGKCARGGCPSVPSEIVSWWPGEGNGLDTVGVNHGTPTNGASFGTGSVGEAFVFDGVDDYVSIPHDASIFFANDEPFTLEAWFKPESSAPSYFILKNAGYGIRWQGPSQPLLFYDGNNHQGSKNSWQLGQWHHVVLTDDGTSSVKLYIDGVLDKSDARTPNRFPCLSSTFCFPLQFGAWFEPGACGGGGICNQFFRGQVDEVTLYSRALSAAEIYDIFLTGASGKCGAQDADGDGYSAPDDCDDLDPAIHPGVPEVCDGIDNDCTGAQDDGLAPQPTRCGVGACAAAGQTTCVNGVPGDNCTPGQPIAEVCDGLDDDCDGMTDEALGATTCGTGECQRTVENCVNGTTQTCAPGTPMAEVCNGLDDDCDGSSDEGLGVGTVSVSLDPVRLWPPNHRMVDVHATVAVSGGCPGACPAPEISLASVTSSEPDDSGGVGDGHTANDIQDASVGSADFDIKLRAERDSKGEGRLYEIAYRATDCFGDTALGYGGVIVPHDEGGLAEPLLLDVVERPGGSYALEWSPIVGATSYNIVRGSISSIRAVGSFTVIEGAECLSRGRTTTELSGQAFEAAPIPGEVFFYLVEYFDGRFSGYGTATGVGDVVVTSGDACH